MNETRYSNCCDVAPYVLLFSGHRIDAKGRKAPRFPSVAEGRAHACIKAELVKIKAQRATTLLGIAGAASGGDILFHEVCDELDIPTRLYLALPENEYSKASVADAGAGWVQRFRRLCASKPVEILVDTAELPCKPEYNVWQRVNLWMLQDALAISARQLTLLALWNGEAGDGSGGTGDMVTLAKRSGATLVHLDSRALIRDTFI